MPMSWGYFCEFGPQNVIPPISRWNSLDPKLTCNHSKSSLKMLAEKDRLSASHQLFSYQSFPLFSLRLRVIPVSKRSPCASAAVAQRALDPACFQSWTDLLTPGSLTFSHRLRPPDAQMSASRLYCPWHWLQKTQSL